MCCMSPTFVAEPLFPSFQLWSVAFFAYCGCACVVSEPMWGRLGLELSQIKVFARDAVAPNFRGDFPVLYPEMISLVRGTCSQTRCLPPAQWWGLSWTELA